MKNALLLFIFWLLFVQISYGQIKPEDTEVWTLVPEVVTPGKHGSAPSDAIILFDGKDLSQWQKHQSKNEKSPAPWILKNGAIEVKPGTGDIETKQKFGDIQLHIEWLSPVDEGKEGQAYSNSGIFFMGLYEVQVLNSYKNKTYSNGQAGAVYKQHIPLVNAARPPGEWQEYNIIFTAPKFKKNGKVKSPARLTVFHNGVLIQNHVELRGPTINMGHPKYIPHSEKLSLRLQDHGDKVRYRNIWVREL